MKTRRHLAARGLLEIIDIVVTMNSAQRPALDKIKKELLVG
jgi:hypothetical protein